MIHKAPPAAVVERYGVAPGRGFVWIPGYHNWVGGRYIWVPGKWARPPYRGAHWVPYRWIRRPHGGWVLIGGHWR